LKNTDDLTGREVDIPVHFGILVTDLKVFLSKIWTVWCVLAISVVIIFLYPVFSVAVHSGIASWKVWAHKLVQRAARVVMLLWGIRIKVHQRELIDSDRQYVYIGNHRSDLDAILTLAALEGYWKYLGKAELLKYPVVGYLVGQLYITVDRSSRASREESIRQMQAQAADGASITVFPEGWSNFSRHYLLPIRHGAFNLALSANLPLAVFTVIGTHELWPKPYWRLRPGTVHFFYEGVIETAGCHADNEDHRRELEEKAAAIWLKRLKAFYPDGYQYAEGWPDFTEWMNGMLGRRPGRKA
jgi:1-acyl-sn-glycerol-3-phosphate acyltransferase